MFDIVEADPGRDDIQILIQELDDYQNDLYPPESNHLDGLETLRQKNVLFLCAQDASGALGIGAVKVMPGDFGEIKRVYVPNRLRGRGIAKAIMIRLESHLITQGVAWAKLETGIYQPEAIGLYESFGYEKCQPFGDYLPDPNSVFMAKRLLP